MEKSKNIYSEDEIKVQMEKFHEKRNAERGKIQVLYLDDEEMALKGFKALFRMDYKVFITTSHEEATKLLDENNIHVIITDQRMPEVSGVEFLSSIIEKHPDPVRILLTGYSDINAVIDAINEGKIYRYMAKPYMHEDMKRTIENAAEIYYLRKNQNKLLRELILANGQLEFMLQHKNLES